MSPLRTHKLHTYSDPDSPDGHLGTRSIVKSPEEENEAQNNNEFIKITEQTGNIPRADDEMSEIRVADADIIEPETTQIQSRAIVMLVFGKRKFQFPMNRDHDL